MVDLKGWLLLRRDRMSNEERTMIMGNLGKDVNRRSVTSALYFTFAQDSSPDRNVGYDDGADCNDYEDAYYDGDGVHDDDNTTSDCNGGYHEKGFDDDGADTCNVE